MKRLYLVRHGESASNAGLVTDGPVLNPLTERGRKQAEGLAREWIDEPDLVVTSGFIRTQQTAQPTIERFPYVNQERWEVQELTQLAPERYKGTTHADRRPAVIEYWKREDPNYIDGDGAESFTQFGDRVLKCLQRTRSSPSQNIVIFTHGVFIQAALYYVLRGNLSMRSFFRFSTCFPIENIETITLYLINDEWTAGRVTGLAR